MNKFYNFITNNNEKELYLYGAIVSDKWFEDEVSVTDFRTALEEMENNELLNIYVNSPGGEVFVTQSIIAMLKRAKDTKSIKINVYIDGLGASCASWLPMIADNIFIYQGSILMLHKPMAGCWGNANDMRKQIELLDKIEDSEMIPMYMSKTKDGITEEKIREILSNETWLTCDEIQELFNVTLLESDKKMTACVDNDLFKSYKNTPKELLDIKVEDKHREPANEDVEKAKVFDKEMDIDLELMKLELGFL